MKNSKQVLRDIDLINYNVEKQTTINRNLYGFFIVYFIISVINLYLVIYLPLYLLNVRGVDRNQLGIIQMITLPLMLLAPLLGFLFDLNKKPKPIIFSLVIIFLFSFFNTTIYSTNLFIFSLSLALNLLSQEAIKVGISKMIIELAKNEAFKDKYLAAINISSNLGSLIPSILFLIFVTDIYNLNQWYTFFLIGFMISLSSLTAFLFFNNDNKLIEDSTDVKEKQESITSRYFVLFLLLFISYFLIWSDKLYQFPLSSWIFSRFGASVFNVYSFFYVIFVLLNILGWILGEKMSKIQGKSDKGYFNNKINMILVSGIIYAALIFFIPLSNLIVFLVLNGTLYLVSGILMLNFVSLLMSVSSKGKYKTFSFQCLKSAYLLSSSIFIPLGTLLSANIQTEIIFVIVSVLSLIALIPLIFLRSMTKIKNKKLNF